MGKKMLMIVNPHSGKAQIKNQLLGILDTFCKVGYEVTVQVTQYPGQASEITADQAEAYDMVVLSGGDGTLNEVLCGLMKCQKRPVLGYIPSGSTNDFASTLKLPKNMQEAARIVAGGREFLCDIGKFGMQHFVYVAAFGAFTEVSYTTPQQTKNVLGHPAYILEGAKRLDSIKPHHMKVISGELVIEDDFLYGMVSNATSVAGFKGLTGDNVQLDDGLFEVTLVKDPQNPLEMPALLTALTMRKLDSPYFYHFQPGHLKVEAEKPVKWVLDGEFGGNLKDVEIENIPGAFQIMVGEK